jgi:hypothetical protein
MEPIIRKGPPGNHRTMLKGLSALWLGGFSTRVSMKFQVQVYSTKSLLNILVRSGPLWLPSRQYMSTRQETCFPGPEVINENNTAQWSSTGCLHQETGEWALIGWVMPCDKVRWPVFNFSAYKSLGQDGIFPTILQDDLVIKYLEPVLLFDIFHCPGVWS